MMPGPRLRREWCWATPCSSSAWPSVTTRCTHLWAQTITPTPNPSSHTLTTTQKVAQFRPSTATSAAHWYVGGCPANNFTVHLRQPDLQIQNTHYGGSTPSRTLPVHASAHLLQRMLLQTIQNQTTSDIPLQTTSHTMIAQFIPNGINANTSAAPTAHTNNCRQVHAWVLVMFVKKITYFSFLNWTRIHAYCIEHENILWMFYIHIIIVFSCCALIKAHWDRHNQQHFTIEWCAFLMQMTSAVFLCISMHIYMYI